MLGWSPTYDVQPLEGGGWRVEQTSPEWDETERNMALATDLIDVQTCGGCGGDLTVELTDQAPVDDPGDGHFHRFTPVWCRGCVSRIKLQRQTEKADEELRGTPADPYPGARIFLPERLPIPKTPDP